MGSGPTIRGFESLRSSQIRILNFFKVVMWFRKDYSFRFVIEHGELTFTSYFYFVRSGDVGLGNGSLRNFGRNGNGWSRSAMAYGVGTWAANAYRLAFDPSTVYPSYGPDARWYGIPVRCLGY